MHGHAGGFAAKHRAARQDLTDDRIAVRVIQAVDQDPVVDCRIIRRICGRIAELAGDDRLHFAGCGDDAVLFLVLDRHAGQKAIRNLRSLPQQVLVKTAG